LEVGEQVASSLPLAGQLVLLKLALQPNGETRQELHQLLWPDVSSERGSFYLRRTLTQIRKALGPARGLLEEGENGRLKLNLDGCQCDIQVFRELRRSDNRSNLYEAISLHRGPLMAKSSEPWVELERETFRIELNECLCLLAEDELTHGQASIARRLYLRVLTEDPFDERVLRSYMVCLSKVGAFPEITRVHSAARKRFDQVLQMPLSAETEQTYRDLIRQANLVGDLGAPLPVEAPSRPLPQPLTSLVGREMEIASIRSRVLASRLVTLVGMPGVGKSRLALAVASALEFQSVGWIDLTGPSSETNLVTVISNHLRLHMPEDLSDSSHLAILIGGRELVLILDNVDAVHSQVHEVVTALLGTCRNVRFLITTRAPMDISGQVLETIEPLDCGQGLATTLESPAARLFLDRAKSVKLGFSVEESDVAVLRSILRKLDGLPFSLEIAAKRVRTVPLAEIDRQLDMPLQFLGSEDRGRSLQSMLESSFQGLPKEAQDLLVCLEIFEGTWTGIAAFKICSKGSDQTKFQEDLSLLVGHSFVTMDANGRYHLLQSVHAFAKAMLVEKSDLVEPLHSRYATYYADHFELILDSAHPLNLAALEEDEHHMRQIILWAVQHRHPTMVDAALKIVNHSFHAWRRLGRITTSMNMGLQVLEAAEGKVDDRVAEVLLRCAVAAHSLCRFQLAEELLLRAQEMFMTLGLELLSAEVLRALGDLAANTGRLKEAQDFLTQAKDRFAELGDRHGEAKSLAALGYAAREGGEHAEAKRITELALAQFTKLGDMEWRAWCVGSLGGISIDLNEYDDAKRYLQESLAGQERAENREGIAWNTTMIGVVYSRTGQHLEAIQWFRRAISMHSEDSLVLSWPMGLLGEALVLAGEYNEARTCLERAVELQSQAGESKVSGLLYVTLAKLSLEQRDLVSAETYTQMASESTENVQNAHLRRQIETLRQRISATSFSDTT
jgi:predicted ATPase/DNA-binding SARP family transcriptional activator/Tfp pilus assembly protein PilF